MTPTETMLAMAVDDQHHRLVPVQRPVPVPGPHEVLLRVRACGVCRTDLHLIDADLPPHRAGVVPGHEIVGEVIGLGPGAGRWRLGQRLGVPWLGGTCGHCGFCAQGRENLCDTPVFTGYDRDGGFAACCTAHEDYAFALPEAIDDAHAAPLLCAGLIGFRAWRLAGAERPRRLGIWGFGAAAHILCPIALAHGQSVFAFTRAGDAAGQAFARSLGACWAGASDAPAPEPLDASLIFAPEGALVPAALAATRKGGVVVCAGIHMSALPSFPYALLWGERTLRSVANLTRADGEDFFALLARLPVQTQVQTWPLQDAPAAVQALRSGAVHGAAVLLP